MGEFAIKNMKSKKKKHENVKRKKSKRREGETNSIWGG